MNHQNQTVSLYIVDNFVANFTVPNLMCPTSYQNPLITSDGSIYIAIPGGRVAPAYITKLKLKKKALFQIK